MIAKCSQNHIGKITNISILQSDVYRSRTLIHVHDSPMKGAISAYNVSAAVFGRACFIFYISGSQPNFVKRDACFN